MTSERASRKKRRQAMASQAEREQLAIEVRRLRSLLEEIAEVYVVRVSAILQRITDHFEGKEVVQDRFDASLSMDEYERIFSSVRRLDVNPKKGRRKDLKRIESLAAEIEEIINR